MYRIIKTELWKLKRYHIIWAGILLMLLSVGITLFASTALDGTVWTFPHLVERVIQNNTTTIFPMCIIYFLFLLCSKHGYSSSATFLAVGKPASIVAWEVYLFPLIGLAFFIPRT